MTRLPSALALAVLLAFGLALAAAAIIVASERPWLGLALAASDGAAGDVIVANATGPAAHVAARSRLQSIAGKERDALTINARDLIEEPDALESYAAMHEFFDRQDRLAAMLEQGSVTVSVEALDGQIQRIVIQPQDRRPLSSYPFAFYLQLLVGFTGFAVGAWVWSLRRGELAPALLAAAGFGLLMSAFPAAIYSSREVALSGAEFWFLSKLNHAGAMIFGVALIGVFLQYPAKLVSSRLIVAPACIFTIWTIANVFELPHSPAIGVHLSAATAMAAIASLIGVQYHATRRDPVGRAALGWLGLSVVAGAGAFVLTIVAPRLVGLEPPISQGIAFLFFLLIYLGVALGVGRYRLFDLGEWAFRVWFYVGGIILLFGLDALLIFTVVDERMPAFALSLLAVALVYLPLRDLLKRLFWRDRIVDPRSRFDRIMAIALAPPDQQAVKWKTLLETLYRPLTITEVRGSNAPGVAGDGVALVVAATSVSPAFCLQHADHGGRLFSSRDEAAILELATMLEAAVESRVAHEKGVLEERTRLARDIHDNIGIQLLSVLHNSEPERMKALVRQALGDLRDVINHATDEGLSADGVISSLRGQIAETIEATGMRLDWSSEIADRRLDVGTASTIRAVLREAAHNAIRHSGATTLAVRIAEEDQSLLIQVRDNGRGMPDHPSPSGTGIINMRARVERLGGSIEALSAEPGTVVVARLPSLENAS